MSNEKNYKVRIHKLSKYFGETDENFKDGQVHEEEYNYPYSDYKEALSFYVKKCEECAEQCSMGISFSHSFTIQLLGNIETNPMKSHSEKRRVYFQLTMSNL